MKKSKLINQKYIQTVLKHVGHDIPSLEKVQSKSQIGQSDTQGGFGETLKCIKRFTRFQKNIDISKY